MNVLPAQYYAERIASDCGAIHWLGTVNDSEEAKDATQYISAQLPDLLANLAAHLGYRIEKITEQKDAA